MTLSDLASLGSFISGVAVLVTLAFLLLQLQQANRNQRSLIQQGRSVRIAQLMNVMASAEMRDIMARAERLDPTLSESEVLAYYRQCSSWIVNYEDGLLQHLAGTIDDQSWKNDLFAMSKVAALPSFRIAWQRERLFVSDAFRELFDGLVKQATPVSVPGYVEHWQQGVEQERAAARARG
jgi:hypothetical protein